MCCGVCLVSFWKVLVILRTLTSLNIISPDSANRFLWRVSVDCLNGSKFKLLSSWRNCDINAEMFFPLPFFYSAKSESFRKLPWKPNWGILKKEMTRQEAGRNPLANVALSVLACVVRHEMEFGHKATELRSSRVAHVTLLPKEDPLTCLESVITIMHTVFWCSVSSAGEFKWLKRIWSAFVCM